MGGTNLADPSAALLATCGGDTVKLFDLTVDSGDPCALSYVPTSGSHVNSVKWNHTNLVVASAGEDKKITLWRKNGQSMGTVPVSDSDAGDNISESVSAINFSHKGSRYLCSGGSSHIVRIWDLQRKRCIKWLSGHTDTITGVMYNCKDEHLASISLKGDIILHNLASGARAAELKDPSEQVLRVLDYSRLSRHILVTAGDDGSIHLWDTTARSQRFMSWLKLHSAPITGVCFSPSNDKLIASVGLDKKLYMLDSGSKRPASCTPHEAPFSSLAFRDDGLILAAGTNTGRVVFYDIRGKPQPLTLLRAYNSFEAVTSLCWQRSKPVVVNENCSSEIALLGSAGEDSVLMPDPLPSASSSTLSAAAAAAATLARGLSSATGTATTASYLSASEVTPFRSQIWTGGSLLKLQAPRNSHKLKDDMDVFSPLVDVQPITPSLGNWWDDKDEAKKDGLAGEKRSTLRDFETHPISDWRSTSSSSQEDVPSSFSQSSDAPLASSRSESSSAMTSEAWGSNALPDKLTSRRQPPSLSRFVPSSLQDSSDPSSFSFMSSLAGASFSTSSNFLGNPPVISEPSTASRLGSVSASLAAKTLAAQANVDLPGASSSALPRRFPSSADGSVSAGSSPTSKKTGTETREEITSSLLSKNESLSVVRNSSHPGVGAQFQPSMPHSAEQLQGSSSFSLQLVQRTLEESLGSLQLSIHEDVRNLHIELLRQFHMQEVEVAGLMSTVLEKLDDLQKEVQTLRRENQQLRMLL
ncbi:unnamed protein product [Spirodela intermedia]|uniref:Anaphase-promoting complex subunit 4-like WD40 domain-containing protein n=1 Tax=Spirodela intermedia TaxID=51605 RepID=A0A7I8JIR7_SPIIN|nr:unnamed protein product [Spirodela intermedia]CAA6669413.1 unnamed protein product [Spirodela intermedia]